MLDSIMIEGRVTWFWNGGFTCPKPLFYKEGILGNGLSWTAVSLAIMTILLCHELGHYLVGRHYGIPSTLPFFIPLPLPPFGTFGAVIKMKGGFINRSTLFDVGIAGPLS